LLSLALSGLHEGAQEALAAILLGVCTAMEVNGTPNLHFW